MITPALFSYQAPNIRQPVRTNAAGILVALVWLSIGDAGVAQQTPDISSIIQEIVNRNGYTSASSIAIIMGWYRAADGGVLQWISYPGARNYAFRTPLCPRRQPASADKYYYTGRAEVDRQLRILSWKQPVRTPSAQSVSIPTQPMTS